MSEESVFQQLTSYGVAPVIAIESVEAALPLADILLECGLPVAEITFRTAAAADVIRTLAQQRPQLLVGAGTVLTVENVRAAKDCGARFGVAPGLNPAVLAMARDLGLPFIPGVATPSEVEHGLALGYRVLKFFPAGALGGPAMLKALAGPYLHTGVRFVPTGGVNAGNMLEYLALPYVAVVGGTWLATKDDLKQGKWDAIRERCSAAVAAARQRQR